MKAILCSILLTVTLFFNGSSYAQSSKGGFLIGGNFGFDISNTQLNDPNGVLYTNRDKTGFQINPTIGYFLFKNVAIGLSPGYAIEKEKTKEERTKDIQTTTTYTRRRYSLAPFMRYYLPLTSKVSFFVHGTLFEYSHANITDHSQTYDIVVKQESIINSFSPGFTLQPGLVCFLTKKIGFEATIGTVGYKFTTSKIKALSEGEWREFKDRDKTFDLSFDPLVLTVGMHFYLNR